MKVAFIIDVYPEISPDTGSPARIQVWSTAGEVPEKGRGVLKRYRVVADLPDEDFGIDGTLEGVVE